MDRRFSFATQKSVATLKSEYGAEGIYRFVIKRATGVSYEKRPLSVRIAVGVEEGYTLECYPYVWDAAVQIPDDGGKIIVDLLDEEENIIAHGTVNPSILRNETIDIDVKMEPSGTVTLSVAHDLPTAVFQPKLCVVKLLSVSDTSWNNFDEFMMHLLIDEEIVLTATVADLEDIEMEEYIFEYNNARGISFELWGYNKSSPDGRVIGSCATDLQAALSNRTRRRFIGNLPLVLDNDGRVTSFGTLNFLLTFKGTSSDDISPMSTTDKIKADFGEPTPSSRGLSPITIPIPKMKVIGQHLGIDNSPSPKIVLPIPADVILDIHPYDEPILEQAPSPRASPRVEPITAHLSSEQVRRRAERFLIGAQKALSAVQHSKKISNSAYVAAAVEDVRNGVDNMQGSYDSINEIVVKCHANDLLDVHVDLMSDARYLLRSMEYVGSQVGVACTQGAYLSCGFQFKKIALFKTYAEQFCKVTNQCYVTTVQRQGILRDAANNEPNEKRKFDLQQRVRVNEKLCAKISKMKKTTLKHMEAIPALEEKGVKYSAIEEIEPLSRWGQAKINEYIVYTTAREVRDIAVAILELARESRLSVKRAIMKDEHIMQQPIVKELLAATSMEFDAKVPEPPKIPSLKALVQPCAPQSEISFEDIIVCAPTRPKWQADDETMAEEYIRKQKHRRRPNKQTGQVRFDAPVKAEPAPVKAKPLTSQNLGTPQQQNAAQPSAAKDGKAPGPYKIVVTTPSNAPSVKPISEPSIYDHAIRAPGSKDNLLVSSQSLKTPKLASRESLPLLGTRDSLPVDRRSAHSSALSTILSSREDPTSDVGSSGWGEVFPVPTPRSPRGILPRSPRGLLYQSGAPPVTVEYGSQEMIPEGRQVVKVGAKRCPKMTATTPTPSPVQPKRSICSIFKNCCKKQTDDLETGQQRTAVRIPQKLKNPKFSLSRRQAEELDERNWAADGFL